MTIEEIIESYLKVPECTCSTKDGLGLRPELIENCEKHSSYSMMEYRLYLKRSIPEIVNKIKTLLLEKLKQ